MTRPANGHPPRHIIEEEVQRNFSPWTWPKRLSYRLVRTVKKWRSCSSRQQRR